MSFNHASILSRVDKPGRYIGSEINSVRKNGEGIEVRFALVFPDLYEIGMSHLGLGILYHILNRKKNVAAERFFAPDMDYAGELLRQNSPLTSLESKTPLNLFDVIGFSIQYELSYTNILFILELGKIPFRSDERGEAHPLVMGGGPCVFNPEPISRFFDFFLLGDGEEALPEIADLIACAKKEGCDRKETLKRLSGIEGVYVPSLYHVSYHDNGSIREIRPMDSAKTCVRKRLVKDLNQVDYPVSPLISYVQLVHDRLTLEIDRGCTQGCRFCQAGTIYRPVRERSRRKIEELIDRSLSATGYDEFSLLSLSSGDYSCIEGLVPCLIEKYRKRKIALSLPSLRPGTIDKKLMGAIQSVRKTGFTISAEAGTDRLRKVINKSITEDDVLKTVTDLADFGWSHFKFYFMIGLPTENMDDVREIYHFCQRILKRVNEKKKRIRSVNLGIGIFVPKSHTPFQWFPQEDRKSLKEKNELLYSMFRKNKEFSFKVPRSEVSFLEAVFAKGDRRLGEVIEKAYALGCRFDGWGEHFREELWRKAFEESEVDPSWYANRKIAQDEKLPWDHLLTGVSKEYLKEEYKKAFEGNLTEDCRQGKCQQCGLESDCRKVLSSPAAEIFEGEVMKSKEDSYPVVSTVRMRFKKTDEMKYISHLDLNRVFHRACKRAELPISYSEGFHPHPKISFPSALPLGVESLAEYVNIKFSMMMEPQEVQEALNKELPEGIRIISAIRLLPNEKRFSGSIDRIKYKVLVRWNGKNGSDHPRQEEIETSINEITKAKEIIIERTRKGKKKKINLCPFVESIELSGFNDSSFSLSMTLAVIDNRQMSPLEIMKKIVNSENYKALDLNILKEEVQFKE